MTPREYQKMLAANPDLAGPDYEAGHTETATSLRNAGRLGIAPTAPTEHEEQCAIFEWAAANEAQRPELAMLAAIPNGGYRPMATAAALKAEGVKPGYPDILLDVARGRWHGLRIELKRADRSNHATPAQEEWIARLRHYGYLAIVAYGAQEAIAAITQYLAQEAQA